MSKNVENAGYMGRDVVSELDEITVAIANCQVSNKAQTGSAIHITNFNELSLSYLHPSHLVNHLPRRPESVSGAAN